MLWGSRVSAEVLTGRECRMKGRGLGKDQMLLVQQGSGEVVDWSDGAE